MGECIDKRFEQMISAFELGMLSEDEQDLFSQHLLECESCFEKVRRFKKEVNIIRHDRMVRDAIIKFTKNIESENRKEPEDNIVSVSSKNGWKRFIPAIAVAAAILVILILKPWNIEIHPTREAFADQGRLAVFYFDNIADPKDPMRLGRIASDLLITDLSESQYLQVVSNQRMFDLFKLLGYSDSLRFSREATTAVAKKAKARWMLTGSILQTEPVLILTSQLVNIESGNIVASQKVVGDNNDDIFSMIDKLTVYIKNDLSLPAEAISEPDRFIAEYTTNSQTAYQYYLSGVEAYHNFYMNEAAENFEKAIGYDSTFAMAYYYLAMLKDPKLIYKAVDNIKNTSQLGQYYIRIYEARLTSNSSRYEQLLSELVERYPDEKSAYYYLGRDRYNRGDYKAAIANYKKAIELDPLFKGAYNLLAYAYSKADSLDAAILAIDRYIELSPDEPNPYDSRGEIYAEHGYLDKAIQSYQTALDIKPEYYNSLMNLGIMYLFNHDYKAADSCFLYIINNHLNNYNPTAWLDRSYVYIFKGEFGRALTILDSAESICGSDIPSYHFVKAQIYYKLGNLDQAIESMETAARVSSRNSASNYGIFFRYQMVPIMTENGNRQKAIDMAEEIKRYYEDHQIDLLRYWLMIGSIELASDNPKRAADYFDKIDTSTNLNVGDRYRIGRAYYLSGRYDDAANILEEVINSYSSNRAFYPIISAQIHYLLGMTYEAMGKYDQAEKQYSSFLEYWTDADRTSDEIIDARERLVRIKEMM